MRIAETPVLETPRFRLRAHTLADFDDCKNMWTDPEVTKFIGGRPCTHEEVWGRIIRYAGQWQLLGYSYFLVEERATGRFVGESGLANFQRDLTPSFGHTPEIGWVFAKWSHGRGAATEVVNAITGWCDEQRIDRTVCIINTQNFPSIRVAAKNGYKEYTRTEYRSAPVILFERFAR